MTTDAQAATKSPVIAYHFIADTGLLRDGSQAAQPGDAETFSGKLVMCKAGLHASVKPLDALMYAPGAILRKVSCSGEIIYGDDKLVCSKRKVIWSFDSTNLLYEFACLCAEDALALVDNPDPRLIAAIEARRAWMRGEINDQQLAAERIAACAAACAAAGAAAWAATRAAAGAAAWAATRAAAGAAQNKRLEKMISGSCP